jgi:membrane peptidoglycan carboxypeptidase
LARERQQTVLAQMFADGMITAQQQQAARAEVLSPWLPNTSRQPDVYCAGA